MSLKSIMTGLILLCAFVSIVVPAFGQGTTPFGREIVLITRDPGSEKWIPLTMHELNVDVKVVGNLATTTMEIVFYNAMPRIIEGDFYFPLGEGQTVSRFAMDVNGKLREGVPVEKAKGRQVFESTVRQAIDPGLVELTRGNTFKTRIYPIPAKGYKRLLIAYEQELKSTKDGFLYVLPLAFRQKATTFALRVEVFNKEVKPRFTGDNTLANIAFAEWRDTYVAEIKRKDYLPDRQLAFAVPKTPAYRKVWTGDYDGKTFFYGHLNTPKAALGHRKLPKSICLLWDGSGSAAGRDRVKEMEVLDKYFQKVGNASVSLVVFRNNVEKPLQFTVKNGTWQTLRKALEDLKYDGGTQLGALNLKQYQCDEFILSTDGVSNFGRAGITLSDVPVFVLNSHLTAEHPRLAFIAGKTKGLYLNLTKQTAAEAVRAMLAEPLYFLGARYAKGAVIDLVPSIPVPAGNEFSIAGILNSNETAITLLFGNARGVLARETITVKKKGTHRQDVLIRRIWAQKKIVELDMDYEKNRAEIIALGKTCSIVTRDTSLIVLDRIQDYVQNGIVPPPELQNEYYRLLESRHADRKKNEGAHIETVITRFNELRKWWETAFPTFEKPPVPVTTGPDANREMALRAEGEPVPPPPSVASAPRPSATPAPRMKAAKKNGGGVSSGESPASEITIAKWDPSTPYLTELKKTDQNEQYNTYLKLKENYRNNSAFYLDVANFFADQGKKDLALRVLSNIAEMELENHQLLRILAYRLMQLGHYSLAVGIFEEVLRMREEEPQSYRDLGLALAEDGQFQRAADTLYEVVRRKWDGRFPDIELMALMEMNAIIARNRSVNTTGFDKRLLVNLPVDIRVVLTWDADNTDIDLWVTDPNNEKCNYSHNKTFIGGRMTRDFTGGYGPEAFLLKRAKPGKYKIEANYYGHRQQVFAGEVTIQAQLFLNFGRHDQEKKEITLRLKDKKAVVEVGTFTIGDRK